jgi:putative membrane protein
MRARAFPIEQERPNMFARFLFPLALAAAMLTGPSYAKEELNDAQIAHIAYTAGVIDITAAKQALDKSQDPNVRMFAEQMVRDHTAVNDQALALVKKLGVTPQDNPTSMSLSSAAAMKLAGYAKLSGAAFDRAYIQNEVAYHKAVNDAVAHTLIPDSHNAELKSLLETGLKLFQEHEMHAEHMAAMVH